VQGSDVALDQVRLADVRERQVLRRVEDLDGAGGDRAMAAVVLWRPSRWTGVALHAWS
jgi:hypothetical protein